MLTDKNLLFNIRILQRKMAKIYPGIPLNDPQMYSLSCQLDHLVVEYMKRHLGCDNEAKVRSTI